MKAKNDWQADWIWARDGGNRNEFLNFRKCFHLKTAPKRATAFVTAESRYTLFINGREVHRGTSVSYPGQQVYDRLDVAAYLKKGNNVIAVQVNYFGIPSGWSVPKQAGLLLQLEAGTGRDKLVVASDGTWRCAPAADRKSAMPRRSYWLNLEFVEHTDYRLEAEGWNGHGFDDSDWAYAYELRRAPYGEWGALEERAIKQLVREPAERPVLVRCGLVGDILPPELAEEPAFRLRSTVLREHLPASGTMVLTTVLHSTKRQDVRILVGGGKAVTAKSGRGGRRPLQQTGKISFLDMAVPFGPTRLVLECALPFSGGMDVAVIPLGAGLVEICTDPSNELPGWTVAAGAWKDTVRNSRPAHEAFSYALCMAAEEIADAGTNLYDKLGRGGPVVLGPQPFGVSYSFILDTCRESTGFPAVEVEGGRGAVMDIGCAEVMEDGGIDPAYSSTHYADRFVLDGARRTVSPAEWKGLRFYQVTVRNVTEPLMIRRLGFDVCEYPFPRQGSFTCSDPLLQKIWDVSVRSAELCMLDTPMDCPWREKRQWIGDAMIIQLISYYGFGDYGYVRNALRQQSLFREPSGRLYVCLPLKEEYFMQTMDWMLAMRDYLVHSGDDTLVRELQDDLTASVEWLLKSVDPETGLYNNVVPGSFAWVDNALGKAYPRSAAPVFGVCSAKLAYVLRSLAPVFRLLGDGARADHYTETAGRLDAAVRRNFWDSRRGLFRDVLKKKGLTEVYSEVANGGALAFGAALPAQAGSIMEKMFTCGERNLESDPYFKAHTYRGLVEQGRLDIVIDEIRRKWGSMLEQGATSFWEGFENNRSRCHAWAGYPAVVLSQRVLGVRPVLADSGKYTVEIDPQCLDLDWAEGDVPTPFGPVHVSWFARSGKITALKVKAPKGVKVLNNHRKALK